MRGTVVLIRAADADFRRRAPAHKTERLVAKMDQLPACRLSHIICPPCKIAPPPSPPFLPPSFLPPGQAPSRSFAWQIIAPFQPARS
ncbi:hypothetical protein DENSPDRAFT_222755 [Dentipellis sp. KUC8613]|nr:hypothetical protein DENSPDRAFT_222755 [Dentipellis sp. KUC8613]